MENLEWVDKRNDVDDVNAEDINLIAHYAQKLNKNVDEKLGDIETALDTIIAMQNELTGGVEV